MSSNPPVTGTGISIVTDREYSLRVFYQLQSGNVAESVHLDGVWTNDNLTVKPADGSPFASVTYDSGKQVRWPHDFSARSHRTCG